MAKYDVSLKVQNALYECNRILARLSNNSLFNELIFGSRYLHMIDVILKIVHKRKGILYKYAMATVFECASFNEAAKGVFIADMPTLRRNYKNVRRKMRKGLPLSIHYKREYSWIDEKTGHTLYDYTIDKNDVFSMHYFSPYIEEDLTYLYYVEIFHIPTGRELNPDIPIFAAAAEDNLVSSAFVIGPYCKDLDFVRTHIIDPWINKKYRDKNGEKYREGYYHPYATAVIPIDMSGKESYDSKFSCVDF